MLKWRLLDACCGHSLAVLGNPRSTAWKLWRRLLCKLLCGRYTRFQLRLNQPASAMQPHATKTFFAIAITAFIFSFPVIAGTVRVSFLNDTSSLNDTISILTNNGCSQEATSVFRRFVERYYAEGFQLDRSKFPELQGDSYSFSTMSNVVKALPHRLRDTDHSWDVNCFDTAILLANGQLQIGLGPDENFGPFMVSVTMTNGEEGITLAATARDAFSQMYRDATDGMIPEAMQDARIGLTAEFFRWHLLPRSTTNATAERDVWTALRSDWRRAAVKFPERFQVVLYHKANLRAQNICTSHAGLLLRREKGYTYLEKAGGKGPFVRLDFDERADLVPWMSAVFDERAKQNAALFVTFNDTDIVRLDSK